MKLARQGAAMKELATTICKDEMPPLRLGDQSQILIAYVPAKQSVTCSRVLRWVVEFRAERTLRGNNIEQELLLADF